MISCLALYEEICMFSILLIMALLGYTSVLHLRLKRKLTWRIQSLERDLQSFSDVMGKMADAQTKTLHKFSSRFEELEERIMDLSVPSQDASLPLEKRHQVLALARQGVGVEDIAKRLKAPVGEAELILNLQKLMEGEKPRPARMNEQVRSYV